MPSAMNGDRSVHSTSPDLGSAPGFAGASGLQTEALKQVLTVIEKKVRNMEKKKSKLDDYKSKKNRGENLNTDQLEALSKAEEVTHNLDFARELQKSFVALGIDLQKAERKACRREQLRREELERRRLQLLLEVQLLLDQLGEESVRLELSQAPAPPAGHAQEDTLHPLLTNDQLTALDNFYKLVNPERDTSTRLAEQFEEASVHMWELLEGKDKPVVGTTYKALKETVERVLQSGHFQRVHTHQNGVCDDEEEEAAVAASSPVLEPAAPSESSEAEQQPEPTVAEGPVEQDYTNDVVDTKEFVNRQLVAEDSCSNAQEEAAEWNQEPEVSLHTRQPPPAEAPPTSAVPAPPGSADPVVRKQAVQDLMAQMQGTYNFMQDSVLEFDGQMIDPAIVSVQSMSPANSLDRAQMGCSTVPSEAQLLPPTSAVSSQPEVSLLSSSPEDFSPAAPLYPPPHTSDPLQVSLSLSSEQAPPSTLHTGGINVNATAFQSMTPVFNLNTPSMPSANEMEQQKLSSQYQSSFSPSYSSQTAHSEEQGDMQPVVGSFHSQDALQAGGAHQTLSQQPLVQGAGFSRAGPPFFGGSRGGVMSRGAPRAPRGTTNGYRGGYDGYRPPFPSAVGGNYGQTQFGNSPRDYSSNYQRDGYQQQGYKRGAGGQSSRGVSRGNGQTR